MQLPQVTIPFDFPYEIPLLLHPAVVHFVIVIPVIILILEIGNLLFKRRALSITSLAIMSVGIVIYLAAYFTGKADSKEVFDLLDLSVQNDLKHHAQQGIWLVYGFLALFVLKLIAMGVQKKALKGVLIFATIVFLSFVFKQGFDGSKLVYTHGVGVEAVVGETRELERLKVELESTKNALVEAQSKLSTATSDSQQMVQKLSEDVKALKSVILMFKEPVVEPTLVQSVKPTVEIAVEPVVDVAKQVDEKRDALEQNLTQPNTTIELH